MVASTMSPTGSFSRDPIGYKGSPYDLYEFVSGNPLRFIDPFGWQEIEPSEVPKDCSNFPGPAPEPSPGNPLPGTEGSGQNCQGAACGIDDWMEPDFGKIPQGTNPVKWFPTYDPSNGKMNCSLVVCSKDPMAKSPCKCDEREVIGWLWPDRTRGVGAHFCGRPVDGTSGPSYCSKLGKGPKVEDIIDPDAHCSKFYPDSNIPQRIKQCWCCKKS